MTVKASRCDLIFCLFKMWENQNQSIPDLLITPLEWFQACSGSRGEPQTQHPKNKKKHQTKTKTTKNQKTNPSNTQHAAQTRPPQPQTVSVKSYIICIFTHVLLAPRQVHQTSAHQSHKHFSLFGSTVSDQVVSLLLVVNWAFWWQNEERGAWPVFYCCCAISASAVWVTSLRSVCSFPCCAELMCCTYCSQMQPS